MEKNLKILLLLTILSHNHQGISAESENDYAVCSTQHYTCVINNIRCCNVASSPEILKENMEIKFKHNDKWTYRALDITQKIYYYIPHGIKNHFDSLVCLTIRYSKLKQVRADNLKPFKDLQYLDLSYNEISILEPNLFKYSTKLTTICLNDNQIQYIDSTALIALTSIQIFYFYNNTCYSFLSRNYDELMMEQKGSLCAKNISKDQDNNDVKKMFTNLSSQIEELKVNHANKYLKRISEFSTLVFLVVNSVLIASLFCYLSS